MLDWQSPNLTEQSAAQRHSGESSRYVAAPWASYIDAPAAHPPPELLPPRPKGDESEEKNAVHTVCQHVYWDEALSWWNSTAITDVWLSHAAESGLRPGKCTNATGIAQSNRRHARVHAWPLYAVNVEIPTRSDGLSFGKNPRLKHYLASFVGAYMPHYLTESRCKLQMHQDNPSLYIRITGSKWHLDQEASHPPKNESSPDATTLEAIHLYNRVLSDSVFALCPAGAGRNTIRLWEALAVGAIPVLLDEPPLFPRGGSLPAIDWNRIVVQLAPEDIPNLPRILRSYAWDEIRHRQSLAMEAYHHVRKMRCFA
jgi:hypothetical protein